MTTLIDPEQNESNALFSLPLTWTGKSVLEIGSGDGRLTWRYADKVARVIAIEPDAEKHQTALADRPSGFEHVEFLNLGLDTFYEHVTLSGGLSRPKAIPKPKAKGLKGWDVETFRSLRSLRVTRDKKFDLALLSWSL